METVPHPLTGDRDETPDDDFRNQWSRSPFADAYVGRFAAALVGGGMAVGAAGGVAAALGRLLP